MPRQLARSGGPGDTRALPYLLIGPALFAMVVMLGWPVVSAVVISLQQLDLAQFFSGETVWVGFDNYREILTDSFFWTVTARTVVFTAVNVLLTMAVGLGVALLLGRVSRPVRLTLSAVLVVVWAIPQITATVVFQWLFDQQFGVVNHVLTSLGGDFRDHSWFSTGLSTFAIITLIVVWQAVPFVALSLYAAMTAIPAELREAVAADGAGPWHAYWAITWPAIKSMVMVLTFLSVIWDFKAFTQIYAVRGGGPDRSTITLSLYAYIEGIGKNHYGVAAAASVVMVLLLLGLLAAYLRLMVRSLDEDAAR